jgi:hypothetical protein
MDDSDFFYLMTDNCNDRVLFVEQNEYSFENKNVLRVYRIENKIGEVLIFNKGRIWKSIYR